MNNNNNSVNVEMKTRNTSNIAIFSKSGKEVSIQD